MSTPVSSAVPRLARPSMSTHRDAVRPASEDAAACRSLVELLQLRARLQPSDTAFVFLADGESESGRLSYAELDRQARAIGARLQALGAGGERALLVYHSGLDYICGFFGCLYASMTAVPCYPPRGNQNLQRLHAIVADADASVGLSTAALLQGVLGRAEAEGRLSELQWISSDTLGQAPPGAWQQPELDGHSLAFLQYTSGSTGSPKGVMLTHGNLLHNERMIRACFGNGDATVVGGWLPLFHDMGLIGNVLQPVYLGVPCILMPPAAFLQKPLRWLQMISRWGVTTSGGPDFAYDLCVRKISDTQREELDLSRWDLAFSGAEPVRADTLERFAARFAPQGFRPQAFYPCYGLAEATLLVTAGAKQVTPRCLAVENAALARGEVRPLPAADARAGPGMDRESSTLVGCGHAWLGQSVQVVDPQSRLPCGENQVGEIWVAGPSVAQGYWRREEASREVFGAQLAGSGQGPYLRTGDLGFLHAGELFVHGRMKDLIIVRGQNHAPEDIERTATRVHPELGASGCAAFSVEEQGAQRLVIVREAERNARHGLDIERISGDIREAVAAEHGLQVHRVVIARPAGLPKTSSGKVQRFLCRQLYLAGGFAPPGRPVERVAPQEAETAAAAAGPAPRSRHVGAA
ncbi:fatty acyl-AMP ligase [Aquabacterium sp. A7-Y]|uniref:fatty acyl-AMP ligase n=1 Tax=Aquabacterium sp. A7-Y TaxID=1349605 RepID=UPI00223D4DBF|nr:fatty acyl-AMP ligase [Aquabacterium sp. A7-Y]MCW7539725.1 fatty acyl-AMP ligase [Aquabacterium sp. A7-Y]